MRAVLELRYRIIIGELGAGEQLRQESIAEFLGMSRVPVREALRVLADQGLLEHRVHTGYFVKKRPAEELRQILTMLAFLEARVMEALQPATPSTIERLRALNAEMAALAPSAEWAQMVDLNRRFHFEIFRLTTLKVILEELERLWNIAAFYIAQKFAIREMRERTVREHAELIDTLERNDLPALVRQLDDHRTFRATMM